MKNEEKQEQVPYFPLFVSLQNKRILLVGGGAVAARRARALLPFGAQLTVIAPTFHPDFQVLEVECISRPYAAGDCKGFDVVLAVTNDRKINHTIYKEATALQLLVNVADCPEECSFYFPGIAQQGSLVMGVTASGSDHSLARRATQWAKQAIGKFIQQESEEQT